MVGVAAFAARAVECLTRYNYRHLTPREIGSQFRSRPFGRVPNGTHRDIAAIGISGFILALSERGQSTGVCLGRARMEKSN